MKMPFNPLQIWCGSPKATEAAVTDYLQQQFCTEHCKQCSTCRQISAHQFRSLWWLSPAKQWYTLEETDPIAQMAAYVQEEPFFFIIESADALSEQCSNSLLKLVEEPPQGYYFLFLTASVDHLLPTIRSRGIVTFVDRQDAQLKQHPLMDHFTGQAPLKSADFLRVLDKDCPNERESRILLDLLLAWAINHQKATIGYLTSAIKLRIGPGGAKLLWKNLYLAHRFEE